MTAIFTTIGASNFSTQDTDHKQEARQRKPETSRKANFRNGRSFSFRKAAAVLRIVDCTKHCLNARKSDAPIVMKTAGICNEKLVIHLDEPFIDIKCYAARLSTSTYTWLGLP